MSCTFSARQRLVLTLSLIQNDKTDYWIYSFRIPTGQLGRYCHIH